MKNVVLLAVWALWGQETLARQPPNILLIFTDDHTTQAISAYGESRRLIETPNIDRLAREGMRFDRCMVPNPICGPSRASVLTGKYSHKNGFYTNEAKPFDGTQDTFPKRLQAAGYQTAIIGKWHLESAPTGFDHWHILPGQGAYYNPPMIRNGERVNHQGYVTDIITELSLEWLKKRDPAKPFLLMSQHKAPHRAWEPALRHLGWDNDRVYPEPPTLFDTYDGDRGRAWKEQDMSLEHSFLPHDYKFQAPGGLSPAQMTQWKAYYEPRNQAMRDQNLQGRDRVRWMYNRYMHDYLGTIKSVDESVGAVLDFLDQNDLAQNTMVIYASDQGFFLGEHGWYDKRWILEESARTPLLIRWPGVVSAGSTEQRITSVIDFAPTFLEAAELTPFPEIQGLSMMPLLKGVATPWRESFYFHYYEYPIWHKVKSHYGVITDRFKLVHYYKANIDEWELYDREKDPLETRNFIADPAYADRVNMLRTELTRLKKELDVPAETPRWAYGKHPFDIPTRGGGPALRPKTN